MGRDRCRENIRKGVKYREKQRQIMRARRNLLSSFEAAEKVSVRKCKILVVIINLEYRIKSKYKYLLYCRKKQKA